MRRGLIVLFLFLCIFARGEKIDLWQKYEKKNYPARPEIKNGTFYRGGKPVFLIGPWLDSFFKDGNTPFPIEGYKDDPAYNHYFNYEIAQEKGFTTCHPQVVTWFTCKKLVPNCPLLSAPLSIERKEYFPIAIRGFKNLPLIVDYALIGLYGTLTGRRDRKLYGFPAEVYQSSPRWNAFVPFCPEHPLGKKIYRTYWQDGARIILENGGNPWIYELFNEPAYNCRCKYNRENFIKYLKKKYGSLSNVNKRWESNFKTFDEIIENTVFERQKGLLVDWLKFIEGRWCEILKEGIEAIREIDKRDKVYFCNQRNILLSFLTTSQGYDEYKNARVLDVICTEGGIHFLLGEEVKEPEPMEDQFPTWIRMAIQLDCCRAVSEGKPIIDNEQSTFRYDENNIRIPSKRSDLTLMLWNEAIHGSSSVIIYSWNKRFWQWPTKDLAGAEKFIKSHGEWAHSALLNPYCYPEGTLEGIKDFKNEIEKLADIVLPRPRIKGVVALLLSNPSRRYTGNIQEPFTIYYKSLLSTHYPFDIIFEEQIKKGWAKKYKAIISPYCHYTYKDTSEELKRYVKEGGILILQGMDLGFDEYGAPLDNNDSLGLAERYPLSIPLPGKVFLTFSRAKGYPERIKCKVWLKAKVKQAKVLSHFKKGFPVITCNKVGKGRVYYIGCDTKGLYLSSIIAGILKDAGIEKPFILRRKDGSLLPSVEVQLIDRGDKKLYYFVSWRKSELGVLRLKDLPEAKYYLSDPVTDTLYLNSEGKSYWSNEELSKGIEVFLPGEERVLLLLTKKKPGWIKSSKSQKDVEWEYQKRREEDERELEEQQKKSFQVYIQLSTYLDVQKDKCFYIDISNHCNMGFKDEIAEDRKGGWFDQGKNDLREFPAGEHIFSGVPFLIVNPEENSGTSCIVLKGKVRDYFPEKVEGIKVNKKEVKYLYFLHAAGWCKGQEKIFSYLVHYKDGSTIEIPIHKGKEINNWWFPSEIPDAKIAWKGRNLVRSPIAVYCYRWENSYPGKEIVSIDIISANTNAVPGIIAITGELK